MNPKETALKTAQKRREAISALRDTGLTAQHRAEDLRRKRQGQTQVLQAKAEEQEILSWDIPGLFPTPPDLAERMVQIAYLWTGTDPKNAWLEPSAGTGNIAHAIHKVGFAPICVEINYTLAERLRKQGFNVYCQDFLEHNGIYKAIVMNPPFERGQDIDHVRHAYALLQLGGCLVAIVSSGTLQRSDRKAREFQNALDEAGYESEPLPAGTFKTSGTMVNARLIILRKD